ncbi:MAG: LysR family transcriptional regulator [Burkholderiaceae bacterium]
MDLDLLKTFLEVSRTRHFGQAAENLFLTQSAVSSRLRMLEQIVGIPLLSRVRGNIQPTPAGHKLLRHAEQIMDAWNRARMDIAVEEESMTPLTIGAVPNVWDSVLQEWVHVLRYKMSYLSITAEIHPSQSLMQRLQQGTIDVAFLFEAASVTGMESKLLGEVPLVLVSSTKGQTVDEAMRSGYVLVEWGAAFATAHTRHFPDAPAAVARFSLGNQAYEFIRACGGSSYLAEPIIAGDLEKGDLFLVDRAPKMSRTAYAVFNPGAPQAATIKRALKYLTIESEAPATAC